MDILITHNYYFTHTIRRVKIFKPNLQATPMGASLTSIVISNFIFTLEQNWGGPVRILTRLYLITLHNMCWMTIRGIDLTFRNQIKNVNLQLDAFLLPDQFSFRRLLYEQTCTLFLTRYSTLWMYPINVCFFK